MRRTPHLVFAASIALLIGGYLFITSVLSRPPSPLDSKIADAERNLYYRLDDRGGVALGLSGREEVVKLIAHAVLPPPFVPDRRVEFGVGVELWSPAGDRLLDAELHTTARQSKDDLRDGLYRHENAFSLDSDVEFSDDRVLLVTLPQDYPLGSELRLRKLGDVSEVIVRGYARRRRSSAAREQALLVLDSTERDELIARSTYLPWVFMPARERLRRVMYRFERLSAVGELDIDFRTAAVWYAGYRKPWDDVARTASGSPTIEVSKTASVALPVSAVARVEFANRSAANAPLSLTQVTATGTVVAALDIAPGAAAQVEIDKAAASLLVTSASPLSLTLLATSTARDTGVRSPLQPRWVTTRWTPIAPDSPATFSLVRSTNPADRQVRITARAVGPPSKTLSEAPLTANDRSVRIAYIGASGAVLGRQQLPVPAVRSSFDLVEQPGDQVSSVGDVAVTRVVVPVGTVRVRIASPGGQTIVRAALFAAAPTGTVVADAADELAPIPAEFRWRFTRPPTQLWFDVIPDGQPQLLLRGQRRPEPR